MPSMFEIYQSHASRYHELVLAEDFENNLGVLLHNLIDWRGLSVLEAGVGTGRVTKLYIAAVAAAVCSDQYPHMLDFARQSLADYSPKLTFQLADNTKLPDFASGFDVFIEGWSFGHSIMACADEQELCRTADLLLANTAKNLSPNGTTIIIETLGTNVDIAAPPHEKLKVFYDRLVQVYGFRQYTIRTDYRFPTNQQAADVMGFFFGEAMQQSVCARSTSTIPEWTGLWIK